MLTIQDKIDFLNEKIISVNFTINALTEAIGLYPDHDKPNQKSRSQVLSENIELKAIFEAELLRLTSTN
jgi:hypothetical protein